MGRTIENQVGIIAEGAGTRAYDVEQYLKYLNPIIR